MSEHTPDELDQKLTLARELHDRAAADYAKCVEFNRLMSEVLDTLENRGLDRRAGKVMSLLMDCSPKEGSRCDKSSLVAERIKKL